jgi:peptidoglycan/xylan/chitin deacetylase (PgdA/CDA1 family)
MSEMLHRLTQRLRAAPERLRRRSQALLAARACARHPNPLAHHGKGVVTTFFDVEGNYAMPGMHGTCIATVEKILRIQGDLGIRSTYNVVGEFALDAPDMITGILEGGHEVASHSLRHRVLTTLRGAELEQDVDDAKRAFDTLGIPVNGHRSPQSAWNHALMKTLHTRGFRWNAEDGPEAHPYPLARGPDSALWRFPVRDDDWHYEANGARPHDMLRRWQRVVETHLGAAARAGNAGYVAIGFHPWVERSAGRLSVFKDFMAWLREYPDIEIMPFGQVVDLIDAAAVTSHSPRG